jgi:hypothetical protein
MLRGYSTLPLRRIALWGFGLHALWEFAQCTLLYDMWSWGFWRATAWMWGAIAGDIVITLGVALGASLLVRARHLDPPGRPGWAALLGVGFVASVGLEWGAKALGLWGYSDLMLTVTVLGHTVGLSPIVQVTALPALAVWLATRRS